MKRINGKMNATYLKFRGGAALVAVISVLGLGSPLITSADIDPKTISDANWTTMGAQLNGPVYALGPFGNALNIGGAFTSSVGEPAENITHWTGSYWTAGAGLNGPVHTIISQGGVLHAGGDFTTAGAVLAEGVAKWNGTEWAALGSGLAGDSPVKVNAMALYNGTLYVGGEFATADGNAANNIAQWDGDDWFTLGDGLNGTVHALVVSGDDLYVGGAFTDAGGSPASNIAKWDGTSWSALGLGLNGTVRTLAVTASGVYAGGAFTEAGGSPANNIARWDGAAWFTLGDGLDDAVYALTAVDRDLYAGGEFTEAGGNGANHVAVWDEVTWFPLGSGLNGPAHALATSGSTLYVGGNFTEAGGEVAAHLAVVRPVNYAPVVDEGIDDQNGVYGTAFSYTIPENAFSDPDGDPLSYGAVGMPEGITFDGDMFSGTPAEAGTFTITVEASDPDGESADTTFNLVIAQASLTVTADNASRVYGEGNPEFTGTITANSDNITASFSTTADSSSPVGEYAIVPELNDPDGKLDNYNVTVENGVLTVTPAPLEVVVNDASRRYAAANPAFTGTMTGVRNGDDITVSYSTEATESSKAGTYAINAVLTDPDGKLDNYTVDKVEGTFTITRVPLTLNVHDASRAYGEENPEFTGSLQPLRNDDNITATYNTTATETSPVGTYVITWSLKDPDKRLVSYDLDSVQGTLTVTPAPLTVRADDTGRTYGEANPEFTGSISGMKNDDEFTASYSTEATEASQVGSYDIVPAAVDGPLNNYTVIQLEGILEVTPAPLVVTADDKSKVVGESNPPLTATVSGFVLGEDASVLNGELALVTTAEESSLAGSYPISASGLTAVNYEIQYIEGALTILSGDAPEFDDWQKAHFSEADLDEEDISGPEATPAGDGVANLLKFAFNMNPFLADISTLTPGGNETAGLPLVTVMEDNGSEPVLVIEFLRRKNSGLVYTPQVSTNLSDWEPVTADPTVIDIDSDWERVIVEAPLDPAAKQAFGAVSVSAPSL